MIPNNPTPTRASRMPGPSGSDNSVSQAQSSHTDIVVRDVEACEQIEPSILNAFNKFSNLLGQAGEVAKKQAELQRIVLPYPRMLECMHNFEQVRLLGRETKEQPQLGMRVFVETGCGKSTAAHQYKLLKRHQSPSGADPVLHANLSSKGTARQLYVSIMSALGDGFAMAGSETTLRMRTITMLKEKGIELLILDEAHHSGRTGFRA